MNIQSSAVIIDKMDVFDMLGKKVNSFVVKNQNNQIIRKKIVKK